MHGAKVKIESLYLLLFRIVFDWLARIVFLGIWIFFVGLMNKIAIVITRSITPPSLFGIDGRITYANRKYQSGYVAMNSVRSCGCSHMTALNS